MGFETSVMNPCFFGVTLQQGVKLIAGIHMIMCIWFLVIFSIYCLFFGVAVSEVEGSGDVGVYVIVFWIFLAVILLVSASIHWLLLFKGANEKSPKKIKIFLIVMLVLISLGFVLTLGRSFSFVTFILVPISYLPELYQLWVVFCFYKEITNVDQYNGQVGGGQYEDP